MNYYKARERKVDGKWDYTCGNDDYVYPVGYCHAMPDLEDEVYKCCHNEVENIKANASKFHIDGHSTPEEAAECYKQYLLDFNLRLNICEQDTQRKCKICDEWTSLYAMVDSHIFQLCEKHNTREEVEKLFKRPGEIWSS